MRKPYLSIRLFSFDEEGDVPYAEPSGTEIAGATSVFENLENATRAYSELSKVLMKLLKSGLDTRTEPLRPGPTPKVTP